MTQIKYTEDIEILVQKLDDLLSDESVFWENPHIEFLGSGLNGVVFFFKGFPNYAIKIPHNDHEKRESGFLPDPRILEKLQGSLNYPKLHAYKHGFYMIVDRIFGEPYYGYNCPEINKKLSSAYDFAELNGYDVYDASGYNVIIQTNGIPVIVDVGGFQSREKGV